MKPRHDPFPKTNPFDTSGKGAGVCRKCGADVPPKPGFRAAALKCPKCGTPLGKLG